MDILFLAILFGFVFGSQAYNALKLSLFPEGLRGFWCLKLGLWLMCMLFYGVIVFKVWWLIFLIGAIHLNIFAIFLDYGGSNDYLATPLHPNGVRNKHIK